MRRFKQIRSGSSLSDRCLFVPFPVKFLEILEPTPPLNQRVWSSSLQRINGSPRKLLGDAANHVDALYTFAPCD
jgi:hypothetical protein